MRPMTVRPLQLAVLEIFEQTKRVLKMEIGRSELLGDWSVQGFGVLRLYIRNLGRLHIWTQALRYPNVSMIHNHSWDLTSTIVCGTLRNERFAYNDWKFLSGATPYFRMKLVTGYRSRPASDAQQGYLARISDEMYNEGGVYHQQADEIHQTLAYNGTVTLMERQEDQGDGHAFVYWPVGTPWGDATPRRATPSEIAAGIELATPLLV